MCLFGDLVVFGTVLVRNGFWFADPTAKVAALHDDVYLLTNPAGFAAAVTVLPQLANEVGLCPNWFKCNVWCGQGPQAVSQSLVPYVSEPVALQARVRLPVGVDSNCM